MAIKSKNNKKIRIFITSIALVVVTFINLMIFPSINNEVRAQADNVTKVSVDEYTVNTEMLDSLYNGCYILYYEHMKQGQGVSYAATDLYLAQGKGAYTQDIVDSAADYYKSIEHRFENYRSNIDYYATDGAVSEKNTEHTIEAAMQDNVSEQELEALKELYEYCVVLAFDEKGVMNFSVKYSEDIPADVLIKNMQKTERDLNLQNSLTEWGLEGVETVPIKDFTVVYGVLQDSEESLLISYDGMYNDVYYNRITDNAGWLYVVSVIILFLLSLFMTSPKIWTDITDFNRKEKWYTMELACIGLICIMAFYSVGICDNIYFFGYHNIESMTELLLSGTTAQWECFWAVAIGLCALYACDYFSMYLIRPLFSLGLGEYIRQYSFFYQIFPWTKKKWKQFMEEVHHIDFKQKSTKTILKIVLVNFAILAVLMCMWMFGIVGLVIYSIVLFYLLRKYYDKIANDYCILMNATSRIANGDLNTAITEDIGVFEPFKEELWKIRTGFQKAVDEETKSQRMKSELITNVSHDLKTPLTAITTYVELLKKEDITEEERRSYIETLEKKSLRLKVLIEDLFEVSKANSNNITLDLMDVDVVNLMKQVSIEHTDKYEAMGIELRWNVPEEKVLLKLDNQKTYRVFENLFVNIQKYAMSGSRVYIDVEKTEDKVQITVKNMSAVELNVRPEELTERFVRGDASRNTEGSGLGLAIAKSFTEAQNGNFKVEVDGDLFKTILNWNI